MQAGAGLQGLGELQLLAQLTQATHVIEGETKAVDRPLEDQQQAIAAVDQATAPALLQFQNDAVMGAEQVSSRRITESLDQMGGVHHVGEQQRTDLGGG